jgi:DNA polymerase III epsilon subunit-like protein
MTTPVPSALAGRELIVVDVEGNGQNPPEIIEFAALPVDKAVVDAADIRTWLIRPSKPITPIVSRTVHGIRNADVADCPRWSEVAPAIAKVMDDRVLVAHGAGVERRVIGAHLPDWQPPRVLDTMRLAKSVWSGLSSYALDKLVAHAGLDLTAVAGQRPHRAAYDTWCAWQLLRALVDHDDLDWPGLLAAATLPGSGPPSAPPGGLW